MDKFFTAPIDNGSTIGYIWQYFSTGVGVDSSFYIATPTAGETEAQFEAAGLAASITYDTTHSYTITNTQNFTSALAVVARTGQYSDLLGLPVAPQIYQAVLSQSGTAAPTSNITPINTYSGGPTFTLARSSAGVYTITASSAVFNTSGKTAVIIGPLNNLNGAFTAVVTSTTVVTITTAVQSLAVLGLLGFTATPTDALLSKTLVEIRTYP